MNCLLLMHEYDALIRAVEMNQATEENKKRLVEVIDTLQKRHDDYIPSWEEVEKCNHV